MAGPGTLSPVQVVLLVTLGPHRPVARRRDPVTGRKKFRLNEKNAPDLFGVGWPAKPHPLADLGYPLAHLVQTLAAVPGAKAFPRQPDRQAGIARKVCESADRVVWCSELEEEGRELGRLESSSRGWLPEIDLF